MTTHTNRLAQETSPYLLQHAHNPVDWYPWGEEALARARAEDKPILLSIGYSACHWCHVMEHESFEDEAVARLMNEHFVCIKVDREERPDLDKIYQLAHQMLARRAGGWPLNVFLMPGDHTPFFAGTYFPSEPRYGMPSFVDVLRRVAAFYREHRNDLEQQNAAVREAFDRIQSPAPAGDAAITPAVLTAARDQLAEQFDHVHGGFGGAPKFPHPTNLERLLRHWARSRREGDEDGIALDMVRLTLHAMAWGGIYDQVGGGFCRYSVDELWMIPHFEKMLYDNGPLLALYTDAWLATGEEDFGRTAAGIGEWVMREMQAPEGGYYSTLDADSEGEEGKFYVWSRKEVRELVDDDEWRVLERRYDLDGTPNFEGHWHLHADAALEDTAQRSGLEAARVRKLLDSAHAKLFAAREQRVRPGRDEKILTSWNGLMIKGMARAGRFLQRADFVDSASRALDFVRTTLWDGTRLQVTTKDGKTHLNAYLDDYVFIADGALELLQARWRGEDLVLAIALVDAVLEHFEDKANGAFFFTSDDHEALIHRHKPVSDEATPSGNGIACSVLLRLGHLLGEQRYLDAAERALKALYPSIQGYPAAHGSLLNAMEEYLDPGQCVVLRADGKTLQHWHAACLENYAPLRTVLPIPKDGGPLHGMLAERRPRGEATAYLCSGYSCSPPFDQLDALRSALGGTPPEAES